MQPDPIAGNAYFLHREIAWFQRCLNIRFNAQVQGAEASPDAFAAEPAPKLHKADGPYAAVVDRLGLSSAERLVLMLAFLPHIRPDILDPFLVKNQAIDARFTEFGGFTDAARGGFLPTLETSLFLLAGIDLELRLRMLVFFRPEHKFFRLGVLRRAYDESHGSPLAALLQLSSEYLELLTTGTEYTPALSTEFPAERLRTSYKWNDLVVEPETRLGLEDILHWVRYRDVLLHEWDLSGRIRAGYRSLFYGPPGTGKTLSASLLGQSTGLPVYRVDLSKVVSKYIGETEKNLASLFDKAELQQWILFFDEADALFGRRTETRDANDRAANQQVSYLLTRIEDFPGVVLLATNSRAQIDEAFARRFQSIIHFPLPGYTQRLKLWKDNFEGRPYKLAPDIRLEALAQDHELSGGAIINVLRFACLKAVARPNRRIETVDLMLGIRNELHKEGKFIQRK